MAAHSPGSWCRGRLLSPSAALLLPPDFWNFAEHWPCAGLCSRWSPGTDDPGSARVIVAYRPSGDDAYPTVALISLTEDGRSRKIFNSSMFPSWDAMWRHVRPVFKSYRNVGFSHGDANVMLDACRMYLCPYGGAHEQQDLDTIGVDLTPLLRLSFALHARTL